MAAVTHVSPKNSFAEFSIEETEQSISERFEKQVRKYPRQIAVKTSDTQLTYADLNDLANRLGRTLLQQFRDNKPIAILLDHDAPAVVAIFAALKTSKLFFLLDPALPAERLGQILSDSGSDSIVTNDKFFPGASGLLESRGRIVNLDKPDNSTSTENLDLKISADSIAYILYTSGSTGKPKGVIRIHRNDLRNIRHVTNTLKDQFARSNYAARLLQYRSGNDRYFLCATERGDVISPRLKDGRIQRPG